MNVLLVPLFTDVTSMQTVPINREAMLVHVEKGSQEMAGTVKVSVKLFLALTVQTDHSSSFIEFSF